MSVIKKVLTVTPGTPLSVVVGAGGAAGAAGTTSTGSPDAGNGGNTTISNGATTLLTLTGGKGALKSSRTAMFPGLSSGSGSQQGMNGEESLGILVASIDKTKENLSGGNGGNTFLGFGGMGLTAWASSGKAATYGGGGGGGAIFGVASQCKAGLAGAPGVVIIEW
ncbi:hypothetical protein FACS1894187_24830 [Synergistales bacterium]|nr:hypothetical protein FACS1894187_24830 [Synergistales bacterium]